MSLRHSPKKARQSFKPKVRQEYTTYFEQKASKLSTVELLRDPNLLSSGMELLSQLETKELKAKDLVKRIGLKHGSVSQEDNDRIFMRTRSSSSIETADLDGTSASVDASNDLVPEVNLEDIENSPVGKEHLSKLNGEILFRELISRSESQDIGN